MDERSVDQSIAPDSRTTAYAVAEYAPNPKRERRGVALCLSGGGYRAALFHLGALRRLNELGILTRIDTFTSVSGGSIVAAHLAALAARAPWPDPGTPLADWERRVAAPFRAFTKHNVRTGPIVRRFLPWNLRHGSVGVEELAKQYERRLTPVRFPDLPEHPRFVFCATDMTFGTNWVFDTRASGGAKGRLGDYQAGYARPLPDWPVARAVAASSCFPPVFAPLPVGLDPKGFAGGAYRKPDRDALVAGIRLSDGGVYDNMGLEPVWKDHRVVLVSDGGGVFDGAADRGLLWRVQRYTAIVERQSRGLRKRWLIAGFLSGALEGTYWGIGGTTDHYQSPTPGYPAPLVDDVVSEVRTDLDAFSDAEIAVLENHGYLMAEAAIGRHAPALIAPAPPPPAVPHPDWMDDARVRAALADSHKQTKLGRW